MRRGAHEVAHLADATWCHRPDRPCRLPYTLSRPYAVPRPPKTYLPSHQCDASPHPRHGITPISTYHPTTEGGALTMPSITIYTNNTPRPVIYWHNLTPREQAEFNYLDTDTKQECAAFVRYRGSIYDLNDMERGCGRGDPFCSMPSQLEAWDNYVTDSYFSGVVVRWLSNGEQVIMGRFCS